MVTVYCECMLTCLFGPGSPVPSPLSSTRSFSSLLSLCNSIHLTLLCALCALSCVASSLSFPAATDTAFLSTSSASPFVRSSEQAAVDRAERGALFTPHPLLLSLDCRSGSCVCSSSSVLFCLILPLSLHLRLGSLLPPPVSPDFSKSVWHNTSRDQRR